MPRFIASLVIAAALTCTASAQIHIEVLGGEVVIRNTDPAAQPLVYDAEGGAYLDKCHGCRDTERNTWTTSGYQTGDLVDPILVIGYKLALQRLVDVHGAVVEHDEEMDVDYVSFPEAVDPYAVLVNALLNDSILGKPLVDFFRALELVTRGGTLVQKSVFGLLSRSKTFPNDPYFEKQWNIKETRLLDAGLLSFQSKLGRPVRIGLIDSGIDDRHATHTGLDGLAAIRHHWVAQPTGEGSSHALAIASLLGDAANDGEAGIGLLGNWPAACGIVSPNRFELFSYNVGDFGPMSIFVADAIEKAMEDGVDVINLSLRMGYSALVEDVLETAMERGIVVVAAAGNYGENHATKPTAFPASMPGVIAVAGADRKLGLHPYSAATGFDVAAPGEEILIGAPANAWEFGLGTSYAAPHVTAAVALMKLARPELTSQEAVAIVTATARVESAVPFLNALAALNAVLPEEERQSSVKLPRSCASSKTGAPGAENASFALLGNYPNPFNPSTSITFSLPTRQPVRVAVYDLTGRLVATPFDGTLEAGSHRIEFMADGLPSGSYLYDVTATDGQRRGIMILSK